MLSSAGIYPSFSFRNAENAMVLILSVSVTAIFQECKIRLYVVLYILLEMTA